MPISWMNYNLHLKNVSSISESTESIPIIILSEKDLGEWSKNKPKVLRQYISSSNFEGKEGQVLLIHGQDGELQQVLFGIGSDESSSVFWSCGRLPALLPSQNFYHIEYSSHLEVSKITYVWSLGCYTFKDHKVEKKNTEKQFPVLLVQDELLKRISGILGATYWVRDMINHPPNKLTPKALSQEAEHLKEAYNGCLDIIVGEDLLACNYPSVYAVGKGSEHEPRIIDLRWGNESHPKITLVGKGVTFDTGGLNIKSSAGMKYMRKDMGGAAHALGLAYILMSMNLPIQLRVLVGAVENAVSGKSFRPSDVIKSRKGTSIEVGDTDAEGRLLLCDLLHEASEDKPDLLVDFATLTGSARVALGPDLPAVFSNDDSMARSLQDISMECHDPVWHMPLWKGYKEELNSKLADINNVGVSPYGDALHAALFLDMFVDKSVPWLHLDFMGWNTKDKPGQPEGGEVLGLRALLGLLNEKFGLDTKIF